MTTKTIGALFMFLLLSFVSCRTKSSSPSPISPASTQTETLYHCAMHPQIVRNKPGDCPICQMRLVPIEASAPTINKPLYYRNPMDPRITSPLPMKDSMGMDYVPVYPEAAETLQPQGQGSVHVTGSREQLIGVKVSPVERRELVQTIRASARVAYDPALYSAILEHQQVMASAESAAQSGNPELVKEAQATLRASTLRLRQLGLSSDQIERVGRAKKNPANLLLGEPGGTVWVYADLYDYEIGQVKVGQTVDLTSPAFPGQTLHGHVRAIDSILNAETRTLRARIEVPNPRGELKPDLYLTAMIHASLGESLAVPETAVMDTGDRQLVYVRQGEGHYEPHDVRLGRQAGGYYEVISGLKEGDQVVASANFFIDSESKIRAAANRAQP